MANLHCFFHKGSKCQLVYCHVVASFSWFVSQSSSQKATFVLKKSTCKFLFLFLRLTLTLSRVCAWLFLSPGRHYCWKLWACWAHQEPQRVWYRWVTMKHIFFSSVQPQLFFFSHQVHIPESLLGYISNPHIWLDPPKWLIAIIPSTG